jgi:hypothetical protein
MTKISDSPTILLHETKCTGIEEVMGMQQNCKNKKRIRNVVWRRNKKIWVFHFSLFFVSLGFNDSKAVNLLGRFLIGGFAVGTQRGPACMNSV